MTLFMEIGIVLILCVNCLAVGGFMVSLGANQIINDLRAKCAVYEEALQKIILDQSTKPTQNFTPNVFTKTRGN